MKNLLILFTLLLPLVGILFLIYCYFIQEKLFIKKIAFFYSLISFVCSCFMWVFFDASTTSFQFVYKINQCFDFFNITIGFGVDGISLFFIILTTFLTSLCILASWNFSFPCFYEHMLFYTFFLLIEIFVICVFSALDLLVFYIFFEAVLIPIFFIIGFWGSRVRRVRAAYFFFFFTLVGSLFILLSLLLIFFEIGSTDYNILLENTFSINRQKILWLTFFISFSVKVPIVPFHIWLPEAHVEAPTGGSVILAGILLKLGTYGFIRFSLPLFPIGTIYFIPLVFTIAIFGVIYGSIAAIRQTDIKRIIAYASVAHINTTILGLFALNTQGLEGAIFQIISHGIVSGALFFCIGVLYDRHHTRLITYFGGLAHSIPIFSVIFLFFTIANIALPGTSSFVGEFLIFIGAFFINNIATIFTMLGIILGGIYSLWLYNRIIFSSYKNSYITISSDLFTVELYTFYPLLFLVLFIGIYPNIFLDNIHISCHYVLELINFNISFYKFL